jgi:hypothetical protein
MRSLVILVLALSACGPDDFAIAVDPTGPVYVVMRALDITSNKNGFGVAKSTWTRIRVNLRHVPEEQRPPQEKPDPDDDPTAEWRKART